MIYTVTFNPALDYIMHLNDFETGKTNRSFSEEIHFGGKGINVSFVLSQLEVSNTALGFVAGFTGEELNKKVKNAGINTDFLEVCNGTTRINVKIKGANETEINAQGPVISKCDVEKLLNKLSLLVDGDVLVLAGSVPSGVPADIYEKILEMLCGKNIRFVVDATGDLLLNVLKYKPFLIKPNLHELEEICNKKLNTVEEIILAAQELKSKGAVNVLVSLGGEGAVLIDEFCVVHRQSALGGKPVNTVGAGDSMVAGFLAGFSNGYDYALKLGLAAGGATACSQTLAVHSEIYALLD